MFTNRVLETIREAQGRLHDPCVEALCRAKRERRLRIPKEFREVLVGLEHRPRREWCDPTVTFLSPCGARPRRVVVEPLIVRAPVRPGIVQPLPDPSGNGHADRVPD